MWIKICANTSLADALMATELGADGVGFVFAPSPRQVTVHQVAAIVPHLPKSVEKIGVFTSTEAEEIIESVRQTGLTGVQLHAGLDLQLLHRLNAAFAGEITIIQVLHWTLGKEGQSAAEIALELKKIVQEPAIGRVLIDSRTLVASGGTGHTYDWNAARTAVSGNPEMKIIAAGGLHAGNVAQAIHEMQPWGVDVASGVEASKGLKDSQKLRKFIEEARKSYERSDWQAIRPDPADSSLS